MEAHLYLDEETFLKIILLPNLVREIRIQTPHGYLPKLLDYNSKSVLRIARYRCWEPVDRNSIRHEKWKFLFEGFEESDMTIPQDSFDIGFIEPNADVNLDKLKAKMRDNLNLKERLLKYYSNQ